jgi:cytochrome c-type biogenesis protein CcmH/NrfG
MAIEYGEKLLQINSNNVNAHYFLAQANKCQGNYKTALMHYDQVHSLRPLNVKIFEERSDLKHFMDVLPLLQLFI